MKTSKLRFTVRCEELRKLELLVIQISEIHIAVEGMQCYGSFFAAIGCIPSLVDRWRPLKRRYELLIGDGQRRAVIRHGKARQRLIFNIRGASAVSR